MQKSLNGYKSKIKSLRKQLQNAQYESDRISLLGTDDDMVNFIILIPIIINVTFVLVNIHEK